MFFPVINSFIEKEHKGITYNVGETYPKEEFQADPERVAFLQSDDNEYGIAFLGPELKGEVKMENKVPESSLEKPNETDKGKGAETVKGAKKGNQKKNTSTNK
jgi:hypothetical protein